GIVLAKYFTFSMAAFVRLSNGFLSPGAVIGVSGESRVEDIGSPFGSRDGIRFGTGLIISQRRSTLQLYKNGRFCARSGGFLDVSRRRGEHPIDRFPSDWDVLRRHDEGYALFVELELFEARQRVHFPRPAELPALGVEQRAIEHANSETRSVHIEDGLRLDFRRQATLPHVPHDIANSKGHATIPSAFFGPDPNILYFFLTYPQAGFILRCNAGLEPAIQPGEGFLSRRGGESIPIRGGRRG